MKQKIYWSMSMLSILTLILTCILASFAIYHQFYEYMTENVRNEALSMKNTLDLLEDFDYEALQMEGSRITIVSPDGEVIYDSKAEASELENHKNRPEISVATKEGYGEAVRYSDTLGKQTFYCAVTLGNGQILRVASTTDSIFTRMMDLLPYVILIGFAIISFAFIFSNVITKRLILPVNQLDLMHPLENDVYEELTPLLNQLERQNRQIKKQFSILVEKQEEFSAITENMKECLIVLDTKAMVLSMNKAAKQLFAKETEQYLHKHILTICREKKLIEAVNVALQGKDFNAIFELEDKHYRLLGNPVFVDHEQKGAVLLILDITETQKALQVRKEFSANVSHELKTPLMSICGYAEIMMNQLVREEDISEFSKRIYEEAKRLTKLIEDIMMISKMDEGKTEVTFVPVRLYSLAEEIIERLQSTAITNQIEIGMSGEEVEVMGIPQVLDEVISNLCINAIKYNNPGGTVHVTIGKQQDEAILIVSDNGIGIPKEHQERIFERFYRVDKSHSRETGGTGLGLSIVKHGVELHHGTITLVSEIGKGTTITIKLPTSNV